MYFRWFFNNTYKPLHIFQSAKRKLDGVKYIVELRLHTESWFCRYVISFTYFHIEHIYNKPFITNMVSTKNEQAAHWEWSYIYLTYSSPIIWLRSTFLTSFINIRKSILIKVCFLVDTETFFIYLSTINTYLWSSHVVFLSHSLDLLNQ